MPSYSRRDFVRLTSCALGGVILAGCGSGNGGTGSGISTPNGYYFYRLKTAGEQAGTGSRSLAVYEFGSSVHIGSDGLVTFDALDVDGNQALFQFDIDFSGQRPRIDRELTALLSGDILADGRVVKKFVAHDVNNAGNIAAVIQPANNSERHYGSGLYLNDPRTGSGFERILGVGDVFHNDVYESTGIIGDVSLGDGNSLLFSATHLTSSAPKSSIFHLPEGLLANSNLVMSTGDYVNGSEEQFTGFGILDHLAEGSFSVTASHRISNYLGANQAGTDGSINSLLTGHLNNPDDHLMLSAGESMVNSVHTANVHYGPRVAPDGTVYSKIADSDRESLIADDVVLKTTDEVTFRGDKIDSFTPGCVSPDGVFYYSEYSETRDGLYTDLYAYDGANHNLILSTGDTLSDGGSPVKHILFSTTTNHIDADGRLVFVCEFSDRSTAVVVGMPV